ncbi:hypothetical protein KAU32_10420 [bacterium]|nr:hypothetical protein [bacterium]
MGNKSIYGNIECTEATLSYFKGILGVHEYGGFKDAEVEIPGTPMQGMNSQFYNLFHKLFTDVSRKEKCSNTVKYLRSGIFYIYKMLNSLDKEHVHFVNSFKNSVFTNFIPDDISSFIIYARSIFDQVSHIIANEEMIKKVKKNGKEKVGRKENRREGITRIFNYEKNHDIQIGNDSLRALLDRSKEWFMVLNTVRNDIVHGSLEVYFGPSEENIFLFKCLDETESSKSIYENFNFYNYAVNITANTVKFLDDLAKIIINKHEIVDIEEHPFPASALAVIAKDRRFI